MAAIVNSSSLWDVRHLVIDRIEGLDTAMSRLETLIFDAGRRRDELGRRLDETQRVWDRVLRDPWGSRPAGLDDTFTTLSSLRAEMSAVEERQHALNARLADATVELDVLRAVFHSIDDLVGSNGSSERDTGRLREASRHLFEAVEEQRRRIARDLRDGPALKMATLTDRALALERMIRDHSHLAPQELANFESGIRSILESSRALVVDLEPATLDDLGLVSTLRRLVRDFRSRTGIATELRIEGQEHGLDGGQQHAIHRIVQQALDNVRRHSGAGSAEVVLTFLPRGARVTISDGGCGFDVIAVEATLDPSRRFGLTNMRERAEAVGGALQIQSHLGRGTEVRATFS
ncbi:MAG: sensor histidine kinase [Candidatus Dormibacteria bacterium]